MFQLNSILERDTFIVGEFNLSLLLLMNDQQYPWFILVPQRNNVRETYQLSVEEQALLWQESTVLSRCVMDIYAGDKLNVATIGNMVPQLHMHHIVRFEKDACWPKPVWGQLSPIPYSESLKQDTLQKVRDALTNVSLGLQSGDFHFRW